MKPLHRIAFVSLENWDAIWRRNQFLCAELTERHPDWKIEFVTPPWDVTYALRSGRLSLLSQPRVHSPTGYPNISLHTPLKLAPSSWRAGRQLNAALLRRAVRQWVVRPRENSLLWINDHSAHHLAGKIGAGTVYDITDDWTAFTQAPSLTARIREQDRDLCRRSQEVIVCSDYLHLKKKPLVKPGHLHLIPNGVDLDHYAQVWLPKAPPTECAAWAKPVFGYTGTVHPDRLDVDLVEALARKMTSGCLVLIGPDHLPETDRQRLRRLGRVILHGPVPYARIPDYMRAFDACIVPHRLTEFTESLNPIKLWEYLAAGKPIVSTPVAGFRDFPHLVHLVEDANSFLARMEEALREKPELRQLRQREAGQHSWKSRVDQVEEVIQAALAPRERQLTSK